MKKKKGKSKISKLERFIYKSCITISILLVVGIVVSQVSLSESNIELEKLKITLEEQENVNQSLVMKINEMASLDNINAVSDSLGLSYNNENIKTIAEKE